MSSSPGTWVSAVPAVLALGLCSALPAAPARAACKLQSLEMPVTMVDTRPITTVGINGQDVKLLVDSGAFYSTLTDALATELQLKLSYLPFGMRVDGITGEMEAQQTTVKRLQLVRGELNDIDFVVGGNEPGGGARGLLGRNLLSYTDTEYDLAHGVVRLMLPNGDCGETNLAYWAGETPVSVATLQREQRDKLPAIKSTATLNGKTIKVLFDTGATSVVSLSAAKRAGIAEDTMKPAGHVTGAGRGRVKAWVAPVDSFEVGGERITNSRLMVADFDMRDVDMLIGVDFFLSHHLYVAKAQRKIYFTYNGGPVFTLNAVDKAEAAGSAGRDAPPLEDGAAYARRGAAAAARRDYPRALADLDRACELEPKVAGHFTLRGTVHSALHQADQAVKDFDTALVLDPADTDARLWRARLRVASQDRDGALDDLKTLDRALSAQAQERHEIAQLYSRLARYDLVLPQLVAWIAARPNEASLHRALNERCWARAMLDTELDLALADCNAALKADPDNTSYLDSRAWVRLRQGLFKEAVTDFDRALKGRPEQAWSLFGRGIARLRLGEPAAGMADVEAARQRQPGIDAEAARHGIAVP